jgi:putative endopeptidase
MKPSVPAGQNFYEHANGAWTEKTSIPADRSNYGMFTALADLSEERTKDVIEQAAKTKAAAGSDAQKVGDYFASFMDEAAVEKAGLAPIDPMLKKIAGIKTKKDLARVLGELHADALSVPFAVTVGVDDKAPDTYVTAVYQSGLGLPDRDYWLKDEAKFGELREKYKLHVAKVLELSGLPAAQATAKAKNIATIEKKLAEIHWTRVDSRDADKTYNKWTTADLSKKAPGFEWDTYLSAVGLTAAKDVVVAQPSALTGTAKLLGGESVDAWKDYLHYWALAGYSHVLPKAFVDEAFEFNEKALKGVPENRARWKRGVELVNQNIGEAVGKLYVEKYFPPEAKQKADALVKNLIAAMDARLDKLTWMAPETKARAKKKLAAFTPKIGYPNKWRDYSALEIKAGDAFGNELRASRFLFQLSVKKLGAPVDREEWFMTPMEVNAYANPVMNEIVFPAAILQPPFFDPNADPAINYGGIGAVIGHEISHHFDDQGRKYDEQGRLSEWWTQDDVKRFDALTKQVVAQYNAYEPLPGAHVNGELTLGENIADLAGLTIALDAYQRSLGGQPAPTIEGTTGTQRFFLGWAQIWRRKYRTEELSRRLLTDPHSPSEQRGSVVRNLDAWYEAFKPQQAQALFLTPEQRVRIW